MLKYLTIFVIFCAFSLQAEIVTEPLDYSYQGLTMKGTLSYDSSSKGSKAGILVVHDWWGNGEHSVSSAKKLAGLGYVALAVDMYGDGKLTKDFEEAATWSGEVKGDVALMQARFEAAKEALIATGRVDQDKVGAIGYCFGGTVVLEMARAGLELDGVVSFHGGLKSEQKVEEGEIKARILVCHGADDPHVGEEEVRAFEQQMRDSKADWQLNSYGGAVHSFTNPSADSDGSRYHEKADKRSWEDMKRFFKEAFGGN